MDDIRSARKPRGWRDHKYFFRFVLRDLGKCMYLIFEEADYKDLTCSGIPRIAGDF